MKRVLKISLFIIVFCLLVIFFSSSKVQAAAETITTIQGLQEIIGATDYSTINGTTLRITNDFTWSVPDNNIELKIPMLTIDFNGKKIKIENSKKADLGIYLSEGKVILKDSCGETGGIHSTGNFIYLDEGAELIIENGTYEIDHIQIKENGVITNVDNGLIMNDGGSVTVKKGRFNTISYTTLFRIRSGKTIIDDGKFEGKGCIMHAMGGSNYENAEIIVNGGKFDLVGGSILWLFAEGSTKNVILNGGHVKTTNNHCIGINGSSDLNETKTKITLTLNGCTLESKPSGIDLSTSVAVGNLNTCVINLENCTIKTQEGKFNGAITVGGLKSPDERVIGKVIGMNDIETSIEYFSKDCYFELTRNELVFKDGKLITTEENLETNTENNDETITKTDDKTNIKLEASGNEIPDNTTMEVREITTGEIFNTIKKLLSNAKSIKVFDITLKSNNENIQPNGKVKISIPIPVGFDTSKLVVYRLDENNNKTEYQVTVVNNYAIFETDHFSTYVLVEQDKVENNETETTEVNNNTKLPKTGEEINAFAKWLSIAIVLGVFWIFSMLLIEREKKKIIKK